MQLYYHDFPAFRDRVRGYAIELVQLYGTVGWSGISGKLMRLEYFV
jgi:hypothetical protein